MPRRIDKLTPAQEAMLAPQADKWITEGLSTEPADRQAAVDGIRRCYEAAGIPWHDNVVWVGAPITMAFAGPIAAVLLSSRHSAVHGAVRDAIDGAVRDAIDGAVRGAVSDAVRGAVRGAVGGAVNGAVGSAVRGAVRDAVRGAVRDAVRDSVRGAVGGAVSDAIDDAVRDSVRGAVGGAVSEAIDGAVGGAVSDAIDDAVGALWGRYMGGHWSYWTAWQSFFREYCDLELDGDLWERSLAYEQTHASAGWWWPHRDFVIVSDRPVAIHREQIDPRGWESHRLHHEHGPAIEWREERWPLYYVHGVRVSEQVVMHPETITAAQVLKESNQEVRRIMCERMGWDRFVTEASLAMVDECDDPANAPHRLRLYDTPEQVLGVPVRVLIAHNATPERDGTQRTYGLTVPAEIDSALAAAAWTFDLTAKEYATLTRAT